MTEYKTTDIVLAAYLKACGNRMTNIERQGNRGTFVFTNVDDKTITGYDLGSAQVEPKALATEIRALTTAARR